MSRDAAARPGREGKRSPGEVAHREAGLGRGFPGRRRAVLRVRSRRWRGGEGDRSNIRATACACGSGASL